MCPYRHRYMSHDFILRQPTATFFFCHLCCKKKFLICCVSPLAWSEQVLCRVDAFAAGLSFIPERSKDRSRHKSVLCPRELPGEPRWGKEKKKHWAKRHLVFKIPLFIPLKLIFFPLPIHRTGEDIESYLPTLMKTMLSTLNNNENLKIKELTVSAIGAIGEKLSVSGRRTGINDWTFRRVLVALFACQLMFSLNLTLNLAFMLLSLFY